MKIDVIVPLMNEEGNLELLYDSIDKTLKNIKYNIIFVDDGSTDNSLNILKKIYNKHKSNVNIISFSRNFGKDAGIYAGMQKSDAEYACIIDADLQQNPKYILKMLNFLEKTPEYDSVVMVNDYKKDNFISKFFKKSFYKIMSNSSGLKSIPGASDFRCLRHNVVEAILSLSETNRFTKGIFSWVGFNTYYMNYNPDKRHSGVSKFKLKRQFAYAKEGIVNFSTKPLKLATILGSIMSIFSFIYLIEIVLQTIITGKDIPGYASIMGVILLLGGIQLLFLGIIGEYIAKAYIEIKNRPVYIIKDEIGFKKDKK